MKQRPIGKELRQLLARPRRVERHDLVLRSHTCAANTGEPSSPPSRISPPIIAISAIRFSRKQNDKRCPNLARDPESPSDGLAGFPFGGRSTARRIQIAPVRWSFCLRVSRGCSVGTEDAPDLTSPP